MEKREEIDNQLQKIVESKMFSRSNVNVSLIKFLVYSSLKNTKLKEATIGSEIFGKSYDPVKNDNKVRVYIHNLRKKLDEYYQNDGKNDLLVFWIPKGQYNVVFREIDFDKNLNNKSKWYVNVILALLFFSLFSIVLVWYFQQNKKTAFWSNFYKNEFSVSLIVGDHFTISGSLPTNGSGVFRDFNINSEIEFSAYIQQHPEIAAELQPNLYPYITKMGTYSTKEIGQFFYSEDIDFELLLCSEWDKSKVSEENIIYIGQAKTMRFLKNVFLENFPQYGMDGSSIIRKDVDGNIKEYRNRLGGKTVDYTIVSKMTGPAGNQLNFFISDNDIGVMQLVNYFTNQDSLKAFYMRHQLGNEDFTALFRVSGWERTGYDMKLLVIDKKQD